MISKPKPYHLWYTHTLMDKFSHGSKSSNKLSPKHYWYLLKSIPLFSLFLSSFMATLAVTADTPVVKVLPNFRMIVPLTTQIPLGTKTKLSQPFHNNPQTCYTLSFCLQRASPIIHVLIVFQFQNALEHTPKTIFDIMEASQICILHYITRPWIQRAVVPWLMLYCQPKFPWLLWRTLNQIPDKHSWQPKLMFSLTVTCS